jgi:hypothetical protein
MSQLVWRDNKWIISNITNDINWESIIKSGFLDESFIDEYFMYLDHNLVLDIYKSKLSKDMIDRLLFEDTNFYMNPFYNPANVNR